MKKRTEIERQDLKSKWLTLYAENGNISQTCKELNIGRKTIYDWISADSAFKEGREIADKIFLDKLEAEADRRAIQGIDKGVYWQGKQIATEKQYSDNLLMFRMKKLDPSYRENSQITVNNNPAIVFQIGKGYQTGEVPGQIVEIVEGEAKELKEVKPASEEIN